MATSATETAKQENGSRVFLQSVIEKGAEPSDKEMLKVYDGYNLEWKLTYRKQVDAVKGYLKGENITPNSVDQKAAEPIIEKSYKIVESMATFTMVKVLKSQKHFHQALAVLEILKAKGRDGERIAGEKAEIGLLIKDSTK